MKIPVTVPLPFKNQSISEYLELFYAWLCYQTRNIDTKAPLIGLIRLVRLCNISEDKLNLIRKEMISIAEEIQLGSLPLRDLSKALLDLFTEVSQGITSAKLIWLITEIESVQIKNQEGKTPLSSELLSKSLNLPHIKLLSLIQNLSKRTNQREAFDLNDYLQEHL